MIGKGGPSDVITMISYTFEDILTALKAIKLKEGQDVFVHSNLGYFGKLQGAENAQELCEAFTDAFLQTIGKTGTLILPAFTYSFCHGEVYDACTTPTKCGMFPEYLRNRMDARRSYDPNFSVVAVGARAEEYTAQWTHEAFGEGSFWERFLANDGQIVCMNFDCGSTFVHYVERVNQVPYRYNKAFNDTMVVEGKEARDYAVHYVYDNTRPQDGPEFSRLDALVRQQPFFFRAALGRGNLLHFPAQEYKALITETLKKRPYFLTKTEEREE